MKRNRFRIRIRIWLALAVAVASLGLASSVQAMVMSDGDAASGGTPQTTLVATTDGGFSSADALRPPAGFYSPTATKALEARHKAMARLGEAKQLSPAERIAIQEDARRHDPRIFGTPPGESATRPVVEIVASRGFQWADAGVGVGAALATVLLAMGAVIVIRNSQLTKA
jgi:hypothetical protein